MLPINHNICFSNNIEDLYGQIGKEWLQNLPRLVEEICHQRSLRLIRVMPHLTYNFVAEVQDQSTEERLILKMAPRSQHLDNEYHWYRCISQQVPRFYWFDQTRHAMLLECLQPGTTLKQWVLQGQDDRATEIICETIRALHSNQDIKFNFKNVRELAESIRGMLKADHQPMIVRGYELFQELCADSTNEVILHGDLHHDNILASGTTWKVIDPHGYIGDPAFEVGSMIFNPVDFLPKPLKKVIARRLHIMAEQLPYDSKRIKAWSFCRTILSAAWTFQDHGYIDEYALDIADLIRISNL